ncbi:VOC family protein [Chloroflexota bacterium]
MSVIVKGKINVPSLHQIGIATKDIKDTAQNYCKILGIGPWTIVDAVPPDLHDHFYHGRKADFEFGAAFAEVGEIEFELNEKTKGHTLYDDFIESYGEGVFHLQYLVNSVDLMERHVDIMSKNGFAPLMEGRFGIKGGFYYFDTVNELKTIWEVVKASDKIFGETHTYPDNYSDLPSNKLKTTQITQVGLVVNNLEEVMENYCNILGIGPWDIYESVSEKHLFLDKNGNKHKLNIRTASAKVGDVYLELIQPLSADNIYGRFLSKHGERIHHIEFLSDDINKTIDTMEVNGITTLYSGYYNGGGFAFFNTYKPLKIIFKAAQSPKNITLPTNRYP